MLLRYHDPAGWPMIHEALLEMGKGHLIGNGPGCLVPAEGRNERAASGKGMKPALTRHSNIVHQRGNGAGNKAAGSQSNGRGNSAARNDASAANKSGKGNGKPLGAQLQKGSGNAKPATQGSGQGAAQGKAAGSVIFLIGNVLEIKRRPDGRHFSIAFNNYFTKIFHSHFFICYFAC